MPNIQDMDPQDLKDFSFQHKEKDYVLLDVRLPEEYIQEHIPGAHLIPLHEIEPRLGEIEPDKTPIFYCRSGKRSMAAATLARDSGWFQSDIFNLAGGITAYQGKTLPDYPRISIFRDVFSLEEVVTKAISLEKGAYKLYSGFLPRVQNQDLKKQIQRLANLEIEHAKVVYNQGIDVLAQDFDDLFSEAPEDIVEGGLDVEAWMAEMESRGQAELCTYFLELALEVETAAYDMYRNLAQKDFSRDIVECFFVLSEQEKFHMRLVAGIFQECESLS